MVRFYAVPAWQLTEDGKKSGEHVAPLEPQAELPLPLLEKALARVEYRGEKVFKRASQLVSAAASAVPFASPPGDLPALLRTADQLLLMARQDAGERALVWRCECGTRYAVPVGLHRPVTVSCEQCGRGVELDPTRRAEPTRLATPAMAEVNAARSALSVFFREAMARGWPVLVSRD